MSIEFCLFLAFFGRLDFFKCRFGRFDVDFDRSLSTRIFLDQRWPESLFQTLTPLLLQYFWIRVRIPVWQFFKFENPTPVQTPATIDPTVIFPCFYLRNDHKFLAPVPDAGPNEKHRILPESTLVIWIWCQAKFLTSHHVRMHRVMFYRPNTRIKLIIKA